MLDGVDISGCQLAATTEMITGWCNCIDINLRFALELTEVNL